MTTLRAGSASDVGRVRSANEDARLLVTGRSLYGVADGMGGHQGGEIASAMAVELAERHTTERSLESLMQAARVANRAIFEKAGSDPDLTGMGTTLVALTLVDGPEGEELAWINVGDSRLYLLRDDELRQLSDDHSLVEELVRDGKLTSDEAAYHPKRNIITRALGIDVDVNVDGRTILPLAGDRFVLCSDGLFNEVTVDQMAAVLRRLADPDEAAAELVRLANEEGGRDNITVVVVDVVDDDGRAAQIQAAREAAAQAALLAAQNDPDADLEALEDGREPAFAGRRSSLPDADDDYAATDDDFYGGMDRLRSRRLTWRVAVFFLALLGVLAVVAGAIGWQARNTYFVGFENGHVAVFRGKPGGTLWFDPTLNYETEIAREDVPEAIVPAITGHKQFGSVSDANSYVLHLREQINATTTTTTTTTTSTTSTSTTTTTRPATTTAPATTAPATTTPP